MTTMHQETTKTHDRAVRGVPVKALLQKAEELGVKDPRQARFLVKKFKVKTFRRLESVVAARTTGPLSQRSVDRLKAAAVIREARGHVAGKLGGAQVKTPGPRGYRIGPVWLKSIAEGKGIALHPSNLPKLLCTAAAKGVELPKGHLTQAEVAAAVARSLQ